MSASLSEVRDQAAALMDMLKVRIKSGKLILHIDEYRVQRVETSIMHRPFHGDFPVDKGTETSAE